MCNIAVLFVDIEGCTRQCEDLPPRVMNDVIETYFSRYLDAVRAFDGEVTEVLGDGLLAIFEGPNLRASVEAAVDAIDRIRTVTALLNRRRSRRHDPIALHIGLNAGRALTGVIRLSSRRGERWFYAASGPVTNIAARLCGLANGGQALTTKAVADLVSGRCDFRQLGPQHLKNVARPVEVVECDPKFTPYVDTRRRSVQES
ncbi:MAG: adenylate/guanylate cyclase domain-containing protein [Betaproteobacteria bacterium]|nr:adenylate/guanylate cyclase domain-containing protein [Betaproteobacteria bacterium]